ncbi:MAG: Glu-tRNA(Gln) amidotransferase subunit GatD [Methanobacteriota archaeon]
MGDSGLTEKALAEAGAEVGDRVSVKTTDGHRYEGVVMPRHDFSGAEVLTLKLDNGYNVGVSVGTKTEVELVAVQKGAPKKERALPAARGRPRVSLLGTGGTIASYVDYRTGAVHPATTAEELAFAVPEVFEVADVRARVAYQIFSEDMTAEHWRTLAREVAKEFAGGARGVVVPHGTDTLAFTAAALSFMLQDLPGPVVLVGAQRSSDRPSSDAAMNLKSAVAVAATADLGEVVVVMHEATGDTRAAVHRGNRVRKMHTSRRDAFQSVNCAPLGHVDERGVELASHARGAGKGPVRVVDAWADDVGLLQFYAGITEKQLEAACGRGLVIAGTGLGHVSQRFLPKLEKLAKKAVVVMASQCLSGRVNMKVYSTGRDLMRAGLVGAEDMTPETAWVKLSWALGQTKDRDEAIRLFVTPVAGESGDRTPIHGFGQGEQE